MDETSIRNIMKEPGLVGIGCFAKPKTISRLLRKNLEGYMLGNFQGLDSENSTDLPQTEVLKLLMKIIEKAAGSRSIDPAGLEHLAGKTITGFLLTLQNRELNLSVFTREDGRGKQAFTANLAHLTQIREKRLN
jgi:hypothetical protein